MRRLCKVVPALLGIKLKLQLDVLYRNDLSTVDSEFDPLYASSTL
jgi:hypothetical protein